MQHFHPIMLYYFKKGKNAIEMQKQMCAMHGEGAVTDQTCQKWVASFHAGDFLLDDAPQSGRAVEFESDQIKTLIESNQCYALWEIANILKIPKSMKLLVKMKNAFYFTAKTNRTVWPTGYIYKHYPQR